MTKNIDLNINSTEIVRRFHLKAGNQMPGPPLASCLSAYKLQIPQICKEFNEKTKQYVKDTPVLMDVYIQKNKSGYSSRIEVQTPTVSSLLKHFLDLKKFSTLPGRQFVKSITWEEINKILQIKGWLTASDKLKAVKTILGTAKSAGIQVDHILQDLKTFK